MSDEAETDEADERNEADEAAAAKQRKRRRTKKDLATLGRVALGLAPGIGYLVAGLQLQKKTYAGRVEENPFRIVNYAAVEGLLLLGALFFAGATYVLGEPAVALGTVAFFAAGVAWGVLGWKNINSETQYYAVTAAASFTLMAVSLPFTVPEN